MAGFQAWDRQLLPQGGLVAPQTGPSLAESFGQGVADLATAAAGTFESIHKTDEWRDEKQWEINQPKAAAIATDLQLGVLKQLPDLKAKAQPGLADYPDLIDNQITAATDDMLKGVSDGRMQSYIRESMDEFRLRAVGSAIGEKTAATILLRADVVHQLVNKQIAAVYDYPDQYDSALKTIRQTIDGVSVFGADMKTDLRGQSEHALAVSLLNGMVSRDPEAADSALRSGKYDEALGPADKQDFLADIESERERRKIETGIVDEQRRQAAQSDVLARFKIAFNQALKTGKYDGITRDEIVEALGADAAADLDNARYMGQDALAIASQSPRNDSQLLRSLSNAMKDGDPFIRLRFENAQRLIEAKRSALKANPEEYARTSVPELEQNWREVEKNPGNLVLSRQTLELSRQVQAKLGVDPSRMRVLPQAMGDFYLKAFAAVGGADAIAQVREALGDDYVELQEQASRKAGPLLNVAVALKRSEQRRVQEKILDIDRNGGIPALESTLPTKYPSASVLNVVRGELDSLAPSFAEQPGGSQVFERITTAVYAVTLDYIEIQHLEPKEAAARAAREVATGSYEPRTFNGHAYRIPLGFDPAIVTDVLPKYTANQIDYAKVDKPRDRPNMLPEEIKASVVQKGYWTVKGDESGLYLRNPAGGLVTIEGKPITVQWEDLIRLWKPPEPELPMMP
jgi:hypothetical protein